jgi:hypothetical protein
MPQDIGREDKGPVEESRDCIEDWTVAEDVASRRTQQFKSETGVGPLTKRGNARGQKRGNS